MTIEEKAEKARADAERRSVTGAEFLAANAIRKSARSKINPLTAEQRLKKPWQMESVIVNLGSRLIEKQKKLEMRPKDGMRKVHKL